VTRQGSWGFVVRDDQGAVRGSGAGKINFAASVLQTEALACAKALHASAEWGMGSIHVETDSAVLVKALQSTDYDLAPEGVLFRDMRIFMKLNFNSYQVTHVSRTCNNVAHSLAAYGSNQEVIRLLWPDDVPDVVNVVVASESAKPCY
jgi:ribonuclease HI